MTDAFALFKWIQLDVMLLFILYSLQRTNTPNVISLNISNGRMLCYSRISMIEIKATISQQYELIKLIRIIRC